MAFGITPFQTLGAAVPCVPANVTPIKVRIGADWPIVCAIRDSAVATVTVVGGSGYTSAPDVIFADPIGGGITALGSAAIAAGAVTGITLTNKGGGYDHNNPPLITFTGGGGTGASATCTVGNPVDLTGAAVSANLYAIGSPNPTPINGANGSVAVLDAVHGLVLVTVARGLTQTVVPQSATAVGYPTCLSVSSIDPIGNESIFDPIPLLPLLPRDYGPISIPIPQQSLVSYGIELPVTAIGTLPVAQIQSLIATSIAGVESQLSGYVTTSELSASLIGFVSPAEVAAQIAAALVGLPPPGISSATASALIVAALTGYSTASQVGTTITAALAPYSTTTQMNAAIAAALAGLPSYATTAAVTAAIAAALAPYETTAQITTQISAAITAATTSILAQVSAMIAANNITLSALIDTKISAALSGYSPGGSVTDGSLSLDLGQSLNFFLN